MIIWFQKQYFKLQIKFLIVFKPTMLFDRINRLTWYKNMLSQWVDNQNLIDSSKILEVGCATGIMTNHLATLGHIPTGVDYSSKMINLAKMGNSNIDFFEASVLDLPFDNESFDAVIAASLLNVVSDKNKAIAELFRTCKPGGVVTVLVPSDKFGDDEFYSLQSSLGNKGFSASAMESWHKLAKKMNVNDVAYLFEQAGLTNITTNEYLQGMVVSISGEKSL